MPGVPASTIIGSELLAGLRPFALPRSYAAIIAAPLLGKREKGWGFAARLWSFAVDRNICHFLWYGGIASEGLRSVGVSPPSKSVCSILPLARHLQAGVSRTLHPALYSAISLEEAPVDCDPSSSPTGTSSYVHHGACVGCVHKTAASVIVLARAFVSLHINPTPQDVDLRHAA